MKRAAVALAAVMFLGALPAASAHDAYVDADVEQWAFGVWVTKVEGKPHTVYYADAWRGVDLGSGTAGTFLTVATGKCRPDGSGFVCDATGTVYEGDYDDFEFDPMLESASMRLETPTHTHTAEWTGGDEPQRYWHVQPTGPGSGPGGSVGADMSSWGVTEATLFGGKMNRKALLVSVLYEAVDASVFTWIERGTAYEVTRHVDGGRAKLTLRASR